MDREHTPGPWRIEARKVIGRYHGEAQNAYLNPPVVAGIVKREADRALIAAAPELLEAARKALESLNALIASGAAGNEDEDAAYALETAIDSATGVHA